jgi:peptidoglycan/xylan/chitin deacetylase (PgdA/CDA1 family)
VLWAAIIATALAIGSLVAAPSAQAAAPTIVSLTFDDGNADQLNAAHILTANGMKGTFYITSGFTDQAGYMTLADLHGLADAGHEIGGHSVTHPDLVTLPTDEAAPQICNDRVNLTNWGFPVTSFAYPFASQNPSMETVAQNCGYNSARGLGDIKTRFSCADCDLAETLPPGNAFNTAAPDQIESTWTLEDLQTSVTQAEGVGGWIQLTFHHIDPASTDPLNITPALFEQFVLWLKSRPATTTVQTVQQAVGGAVKPAVTGPAVPAQPVGGNLVQNPSLETLSSGVPQCWQAGGYGNNAPSLTTTSPGRTGTRAQTLVMTGYVDGDAKWLPSLDLGGCSPSGTPGHSYILGAWYKSSAPTQFALYYRTGLGAWQYWTSSPWFAASAAYQKATWTSPALPAGATGISFGLNLFSNGTLTTDDYELFDAATVPAPEPPAPGTNLVQNAGLETAGAGTAPQCWQAGGYGSNTAAFSVAANARSGAAASQLQVTGYADGDAKLLQAMDSGSCAPPATAGHTYSLRTWYSSTAVTQFSVYYRNADGAWVYWTSSPWFAAAAEYTQAEFTTPELPAGATAISYGLNLFSDGTLLTDDYAMYDTVGAPAL